MKRPKDFNGFFSSVPEYGNLFTFEEFLENIRQGFFIDYDGVGHYAFEDATGIIWDSKILVYPSDYANRRIDFRFSHVIWFNK